MTNTNQKLLTFLEQSPTSFHAVAAVKGMLEEAGYQELKENQTWNLEEGHSYYTTRNDSSIIAFQYPKKDFHGFMIGASHSDSPTYKIKVNPEIRSNNYTKLNVEMYGGAISYTWMDRPLSVAGRLIIEENGKLITKLIKMDEDFLMIPSLAIHMDRNANSGKPFNVQTDMCPLFTQDDDSKNLIQYVAESQDIDPSTVLGHDLFLYSRQKGTIWGMEKEYISAGHLDDLQCGFANITALLNTENTESIPMVAIFDNEEVGSLTKQGADSTFLEDTLYRILQLSDLTYEQQQIALRNSFMVSADNAHAIHPNYPEKADPTNRPMMNHGIVIKYNANQKYTSDAVSSAYFKSIAKLANVPVQEYTNRSDIAGGSTLGNLSNRHISLNTVDIGLAQLAMHSSYETAGTKDTEYLIDVMKLFFSKSYEGI